MGKLWSNINAPNPDWTDEPFKPEKNPLSKFPVPLAYGVQGYFQKNMVRWLEAHASYGFYYDPASALETVILAIGSLHDLRDRNGPNWQRALGGSVNKSLRVHVDLRRSGKWLWGTYYSDRGRSVTNRDRLYVVGSVDGAGNAELREFSFRERPQFEAVHTGSFRGKLLASGQFSGSWVSEDGKRRLPFEVRPK